jgi:uncharacterized protein with von Willebrand factor type A (vWA) domain
MIKTSWGADYVLWLVELYFGPDMEISNDRLGLFEENTPPGTKEEEQEGQTGGKAPVTQLTEAVLENDFDRIYLIFKGLNLGLEPHVEDWEQAIEHFQRECGWLEVANLIKQTRNQGNLDDNAYFSASQILTDWRDLLEFEIERQLTRNMSTDNLLKELKKRNPKTAAFIDCHEEQIGPISREIRKLGKKLATRKGRRLKPGPDGKISLSKSIRYSLKTGGIPIKLIKMRKKLSKPDLWLICDVSNSVRKFIYFMMMLVYTTQQCYRNIRSFLFVDNLVESTNYFQENDWEMSLLNLKSMKETNFTGFSDYGNILRQFADQYLPHLNSKTTVLILGDGKNNRHKYDGCDVLADIKQSASALYWLTPFYRKNWGKEDCLMNKYENFCTGAFTCSNISELERFLSLI